ncbi:hypothetical protein DRQ50_03445 [bacterium]|nr:MAG: hypothetical protein DRQ50_03445 [bacterium]
MQRITRHLPLILLASAALVVTLIGAAVFRFLTDDAYIAFRYISNAHLGFGYVWNAAPFRPVEGYTSFLWVVLLDGIWRVTGTQPPDVAGTISLLCSLGTLAVTGSLAWQVLKRIPAVTVRGLLTGLVVVGIATNRTFLTWTGSGLETALFNVLLQGWVLAAVLWQKRRPAGAVWLTALASLLTLTRPDGLLFLAATIAITAPALSGRRSDWSRRNRLLVALPLAVPVAHLIWRRGFYGEWLPNTFYAKVPGLWPAAGLRYLWSFVLEYGLWFGAALVVWALLRSRRNLTADALRPWRWSPISWAVATVLAHAGFYVIVVGGDHFEYRVFSQLVPLGWVALLWATSRLQLPTGRATAVLVVAALVAIPVPWSHWAATRHLQTRQQTLKMTVPLAPRWPAPVRWYARAFDDSQAWLIARFICCRHQEHKINLQFIRELVPPRARGSRVRDDDGYPVMVFPAVGYVSWVLPHVNIIDTHGLNDYVVARLPIQVDGTRHMAHDRLAPRAYTDCFRPNVVLDGYRKVKLIPRETPLVADDIIACEKKWTARAAKLSRKP